MRILGSGTLAFLLLACSGGPDTAADSGAMQPHDDAAATESGNGTMTLVHDIQPIFDTACTRCHLTRSPFLTKTRSRDSLGGTSACTNGGQPIAYVVPGQPEQSFLFYKLGGESALEPVGINCAEKMPTDGPSFAVTNPEDVERVRQWILAGAE